MRVLTISGTADDVQEMLNSLAKHEPVQIAANALEPELTIEIEIADDNPEAGLLYELDDGEV